jgi:hypothetical protein
MIRMSVASARLLVLFASLGSPVVRAGIIDRTAVEDPRVLLRAALAAPDGQAHGVLRGDAAAAIRQRFSATSPVFLDVETVRRDKQRGCARLNLRAWQEGVLLPGTETAQTRQLDIGIDYCLDGRPPRSREEN